MTEKKPTATPNGGQGIGMTRRQGTANPARGDLYEIMVEGHLDSHWSDWLGGLEISHDGEGNTLLTGVIPDQPALYGILVQIRDMGLRLTALRRVEKKDVHQVERPNQE